MYVKLILRNARRSVSDYLIYIVTMTLCVMLFYAFLSISSKYYQPDIGTEYDITMLSDGMLAAICAVTLLLLFLIKYVNRYMLIRRQKEFAVSAVIGMEQRTIGWLFFAETLIMGAVSIAFGIALGVLSSQFISAMLLTSYGQTYRFSWMLFPDTALFTVCFFATILLVVGLFNIRTIRKIKIIDMLYADRQNEPAARKSRYMYAVTILYGILLLLMTATGISKLYWYYDARLPLPARIMYWGNIAAPALSVLSGILWLICRKKLSFERYLTAASIFALINTVFAASVPMMQQMYYLAADDGTLRLYLLYLLFDVIFFICCVIYLAGNLLREWKERFPACRYKGCNLFFFGQIISKLNTTSKTMTLICLTLVLSAVLFVAAPALTGWALGYLDARALYDVQISTTYNNVYDEANLPRDNYELVTDFLNANEIAVAYDCTYNLYLPRHDDFHNRIKLDFPIAAISRSGYNAIREMLGYEPVKLEKDEFTTQWREVATEEDIRSFLNSHATVSTDAGSFALAQDAAYTDPIGGMVYNLYTDVLYVFPDAACEKFLPVMRDRFIVTKETISYDDAKALEQIFLEKYPEEPDEETGVQHYFRMSTLQINSSKADTFILRAGMTYAAIVLMVICLTILSLQQLSEAPQCKYRFGVLDKLGVSQRETQSLILKQLAVWFGLPIIVAILVSAIIAFCFLKAINAQITAYIGWNTLALQIGMIVGILLLLLACYFISTWIMFLRSIAKQV